MRIGPFSTTNDSQPRPVYSKQQIFYLFDGNFAAQPTNLTSAERIGKKMFRATNPPFEADSCPTAGGCLCEHRF
jgi:hypothetical protein